MDPEKAKNVKAILAVGGIVTILAIAGVAYNLAHRKPSPEQPAAVASSEHPLAEDKPSNTSKDNEYTSLIIGTWDLGGGATWTFQSNGTQIIRAKFSKLERDLGARERVDGRWRVSGGSLITITEKGSEDKNEILGLSATECELKFSDGRVVTWKRHTD
ncbi:MAG: hypothetical protein NTV86_17345 [Planctomycetota bacterium]|nr:hypothetical protein [Planctomycetota bacterium]